MSRLLIILVRLYQLTLSPFFGPCCRFYPSCSAYSVEAIQKWGALKGLLLGIVRLSKCHPFHAGGLDPVPENELLVKGFFFRFRTHPTLATLRSKPSLRSTSRVPLQGGDHKRLSFNFLMSPPSEGWPTCPQWLRHRRCRREAGVGSGQTFTTDSKQH